MAGRNRLTRSRFLCVLRQKPLPWWKCAPNRRRRRQHERGATSRPTHPPRFPLLQAFFHGRGICFPSTAISRGCFQAARAILPYPLKNNSLLSGFHETDADVRSVPAKSRRLLRDRGSLRPRPYLDGRILAAWNGTTVSASARACELVHHPRYAHTATEAQGCPRANASIAGGYPTPWCDRRGCGLPWQTGPFRLDPE